MLVKFYRLLMLSLMLAVSLSKADAGITAPRLTATLTNKPIVFSTARLNPIQVDGAWTTNDLISLSVSNGTLTLATHSGLSFLVGDGTSDAAMTFSGLSTNINSALDGLRYQPNGNYAGGDVLAITLSGSQNTNKTTLITLSPWLDLTAAQNAILGGLDTNLSTRLTTSGERLVPFGRTAGGLFYLYYNSDSVYAITVAAANWGNGRLLAMPRASGNATNWSNNATNSDTTNFLNQAVRWTSRTSGTSAIIRASSSNTVAWLQAQGFNATYSTNWWTNLTGIHLLIIASREIDDWNLKNNAITALRNHALSGGGVIIQGDSGVNDELFDTGILWSSSTNGDPFDPSNRPPQDTGILRALDRANDSGFGSSARTMVAKALDEWDRYFNTLLPEHYNQVRGEFIAYARTLSPTPDSPISDTLQQRLLVEENAYLQTLTAIQTPKFRTADAVYGAITPATPRVQEWVLVEAQSAVSWQQPYSTARIRKRQPTGLYAPPGEIVTVRFPEVLSGKGLKVNVGNNPGLVDYNPAKELPNNLRQFSVNSAEVQVANAMGGAIMIEVPTYWAYGSFNVQIIGAVRHPYFRLGRHTNAEWIGEIRNRVPNCLIIEGDRYYNMLGAEFARTMDNLEEIARFWEDSFIWFDWQRGWERSMFKPLPFPLEQYATRSTVWGFNSGITANFSYDIWGSLINTNNLWTGYNGYHHESGHSHEQEFYSSTGTRTWYPSGDGETYANVLPFAPIVHMGVNGPKTSDNHDTIPMWRWKAFNQAWTGLADGTGYDYAALISGNPYYDNSPRMGFWAVIGQDFNWRFFREMCLAGQTNTISMTAIEANDWRLRFLGQYLGRDFSAYFAFMGVTNSAAGIASVTNLPPWRPLCGKLESSNTLVNTALTINLAASTNVYSLDGFAVLTNLTQPRNGVAVDNGNGTVTYTPALAFQGYDAFLYTLQSATGDRSVQEFVITVGTPAVTNNRPLAQPDYATTGMSTPVNINLLANDTDPDGDTPYLWRIECPLWGTVTTNGTGTVTYTPNPGHYGADEFTYVIHDGRGGEHRARVFITATNALNHIPTWNSNLLAKPDAAIGAPYLGTLSTNAADADAWDRLTFSKANGPAWLLVNPDGSLGGQPATADRGTNIFTISASDGNGGISNITLRIRVNNQADSTLLGWWKLDENTGTNTADASLFAHHATLVNGARWTNGVQGSSVYFDGVNDLINIPSHADFDSPTATVCFWIKNTNNTSGTSYACFTRHNASGSLNGVTIGQTASGGKPYVQIKNGSSAVVNLTGNASINNGQWHHLAVTYEQVSGGTVNLYVDGAFDSQSNLSGSWSFAGQAINLGDSPDTYWKNYLGQMDDVRFYSQELSVQQISQIYSNQTVRGFNPPVFTNAFFNLDDANEGQNYQATVTGAATDSDGDALSFSRVTGPNWLSLNSSGQLNGMPPAGYGGTNWVTVEVTDGRGGSDLASVAVYVNAVPTFFQNPLAKSPAKIGTAYTGNTLAMDASDPNTGDTLTFAKVNGPAWLTVASNGMLSGTPTAGDLGPNAFLVSVTDQLGLFANATLNIFVSTNPPLFWTGNAPNELWSQASNWSGTIPTNGQSVMFVGNRQMANTNNLLAIVGQVIFQNGGFAIGGNTVTVKGGILNLAGDNVWGNSNIFGNAQTFASSNDTLTISGGITNAGYALTVDGAGDVVLDGAVSGGGGLIKNGSGTLTINELNTYSGATTVNAGKLIATSSEWGGSNRRGIGSGSLTINSNGFAEFTTAHAFGTAYGKSATISGGTLQFDRENYVSGLSMTAGSLVGAGELRSQAVTYNVNAASTPSVISTPLNLLSSCTFNVADGSAAVDLMITGSSLGSGGLTKSGTGVLSFSGNGTHSGKTIISAGTLMLNGSLGTNSLTIFTNATLAGFGTVAGPVSAQSGANLVPGGAGAIGVLATGSQVWSNRVKYSFELNNATNSTRWDRLDIAGALDIQSTTSAPVLIKVISLAANNIAGTIDGFDKLATNVWILAVASGGVSNFATAKFTVDTSAFSNDFSGGRFEAGLLGNALVLNYQPPPKISGLSQKAPGQLQFQANNAALSNYSLLMTTNLVQWDVLTNALQFSNGVYQINDPDGASRSGRYYRLRYP